MADNRRYVEFENTNLYGVPKQKDLLNWIAAKIPSKWREFGINLNIPEPRLMAIPANITLGGDNQQFFSQVFAIWQSTETVRTWRVILDALVSEGVNERPLAEEVVNKLKAKTGVQHGPAKSPITSFQGAIVKPEEEQFTYEIRPESSSKVDQSIRPVPGSEYDQVTQTDDKIPSEEGYDYDLVEESREYQCPVCKNVLQNAYQTGCGHHFCKTCLDKSIQENPKCPECKQLVGNIFVDVNLNRKIQCLQVYCKYKCGWQGQLQEEQKPEHLGICKKNLKELVDQERKRCKDFEDQVQVLERETYNLKSKEGITDAEIMKVKGEKEELNTRLMEFSSEYNQMKEKHGELKGEYIQMKEKHEELKGEYIQMKEKHEELKGEYIQMKEKDEEQDGPGRQLSDQPNRESNIEINSVLLALKMIWKFIDTGLHIRHRFSKWHIFVLVIAMLIIIIPSHDGIQKELNITEVLDIQEQNFTITGGKPESVIWLDYGFKLDIPPGSFPPNMEVNISIITTLFKTFQLPGGYYPVSAFYGIHSTVQPILPVTIYLQHYAKADKIGPSSAKKLQIAHMNTNGLEFIDAVVSPNTVFVSFDLPNFSDSVVATNDTDIIDYVMMVFQSNDSYYSSETSVRLIVTVSGIEHTNILQKEMESEGWLKTKHKYIHVTFAQEKVSVHIDETSVCCWVSKYNTSAKEFDREEVHRAVIEKRLHPKIDYQLIWKQNCLGDLSCIAISVNEKDPQMFPLEIPVDWWKKLLCNSHFWLWLCNWILVATFGAICICLNVKRGVDSTWLFVIFVLVFFYKAGLGSIIQFIPGLLEKLGNIND